MFKRRSAAAERGTFSNQVPAPPAAPAPAPEIRIEAPKWLASAIPVAVAFLGLAGLTTDQAVRIAQLHPVLYMAGFLLVLLGLVFGVIGLARRDSSGMTPTMAVGVVALVLGLSSLVAVNAVVISRQDRPVVAPSLTRGTSGLSLKATVTASGMSHNQYIYLIVQGYNSKRYLLELGRGFDENRKEAISDGLYSKQRVYSSRIGPNPDGTVSATFEVPISETWYEQVFVQAAFIEAGEGQGDREIQVLFAPAGVRGVPCQYEPGVTCATLVVPETVLPPTPSPTPSS